MKKYRLEEFTGGWFVGRFAPSLLTGDDVEVAVKTYRAGDREERHVHRIAVELTLVAAGRVRMNGQEFVAGDIVEISPGESTDFEALENAINVVVKSPSVVGDKYPSQGGNA